MGDEYAAKSEPASNKAPAHHRPPPAPKSAPATVPDPAAAQATMTAAGNILEQEDSRLIREAPGQYAAPLTMLFNGVTRRMGDKHLSGSQAVTVLDAAERALKPAVEAVSTTPEGIAWIELHWKARIAEAYSQARYAEASERINAAVLVGPDKVVEVADDSHPHEQASLVRKSIADVLPTTMQIADVLVHAYEEGIHHAAEHLIEGTSHARKLGPGTLVELQNLLMLADGFLTLSDAEFAEHLNHVQSVVGGVNSFLEMVKAIMAITGGAVAVVASYSAVILKLAGETEWATSAVGVARTVGLQFGSVIAGIEIVRSLVILLDPSKSGQQKLDAGISGASAVSWTLGNLGKVEDLGFGVSTALFLGYAELKVITGGYWSANLAITGSLLKPAYDTIKHDGSLIATSAEAFAKAGLLIQAERDPAKSADLHRVEVNLLAGLKGALHSFVVDCLPQGHADAAHFPGNWPPLREIFEPVVSHKNAATREEVTAAAEIALNRISFALANYDSIAAGEARHHDESALESDMIDNAAQNEEK